jgi:hypothetical protein
MKQKMIEIMKETILFYGEDTSRRATNGLGYCVYKNEAGNCCAVGRKMTEKDHSNINGSTILSSVWERIESPVIKELPYKFWSDLQLLHDKAAHWDMESPTFLSFEGGSHVADMRERINSGVYEQ